MARKFSGKKTFKRAGTRLKARQKKLKKAERKQKDIEILIAAGKLKESSIEVPFIVGRRDVRPAPVRTISETRILGRSTSSGLPPDTESGFSVRGRFDPRRITRSDMAPTFDPDIRTSTIRAPPTPREPPSDVPEETLRAAESFGVRESTADVRETFDSGVVDDGDDDGGDDIPPTVTGDGGTPQQRLTRSVLGIRRGGGFREIRSTVEPAPKSTQLESVFDLPSYTFSKAKSFFDPTTARYRFETFRGRGGQERIADLFADVGEFAFFRGFKAVEFVVSPLIERREGKIFSEAIIRAEAPIKERKEALESEFISGVEEFTTRAGEIKTQRGLEELKGEFIGKGFEFEQKDGETFISSPTREQQLKDLGKDFQVNVKEQIKEVRSERPFSEKVLEFAPEIVLGGGIIAGFGRRRLVRFLEAKRPSVVVTESLGESGFQFQLSKDLGITGVSKRTVAGVGKTEKVFDAFITTEGSKRVLKVRTPTKIITAPATKGSEQFVSSIKSGVAEGLGGKAPLPQLTVSQFTVSQPKGFFRNLVKPAKPLTTKGVSFGVSIGEKEVGTIVKIGKQKPFISGSIGSPVGTKTIQQDLPFKRFKQAGVIPAGEFKVTGQETTSIIKGKPITEKSLIFERVGKPSINIDTQKTIGRLELNIERLGAKRRAISSEALTKEQLKADQFLAGEIRISKTNIKELRGRTRGDPFKQITKDIQPEKVVFEEIAKPITKISRIDISGRQLIVERTSKGVLVREPKPFRDFPTRTPVKFPSRTFVPAGKTTQASVPASAFKTPPIPSGTFVAEEQFIVRAKPKTQPRQLTTPTTSQIQLQTPLTIQQQRGRQRQPQRLKSIQALDIAPKGRQRLGIGTIQQPKQRQRLGIDMRLSQQLKLRTATKTKVATVPKVPFGFFPAPLIFSTKSRGFAISEKKKKGKDFFAFTPSLIGIVGGFKGKAPTGKITGVGIRGIPTNIGTFRLFR